MIEKESGSKPLTTAVVVPCYNEAGRLDVDAYVEFAGRRPWLSFIFVDDGSADDTREIIVATHERLPDQVHWVELDENKGKAEAVRCGLLAAFDQGAQLAGYWDADLATPLSEIDRFRHRFEQQPQLELALGSRVRMLGTHIERKALRHFFGRVAATAVSMILGLPVYDTQCGAKLMRATPRVLVTFAEPFVTRWAFDVEILARWLICAAASGEVSVSEGVVEIPVEHWIDVAGSKLTVKDFLMAPLSIWRIRQTYGKDLRAAR